MLSMLWVVNERDDDKAFSGVDGRTPSSDDHHHRRLYKSGFVDDVRPFVAKNWV